MNAKALINEYASLEAEISKCTGEINIISLRVKELEARAKEIKEEIKSDMVAAGMKRASIEGWKINISSSTSTIIEEMDMIPEDFWKVRKEPDIMKIKLYMKDGWQVSGVRLVTSKNISLKKAP